MIKIKAGNFIKIYYAIRSQSLRFEVKLFYVR